MLRDYGFSWVMKYGAIHVYTGDPPASANDAATGTLLGTISPQGQMFSVTGNSTTGLSFAVQVSGELKKDGAWVLDPVFSGIAGWWRMRWRFDDPMTRSFQHPRVDGTIGDGLILADNHLIAGQPVTIHEFTISMRGY